MDTELRIGVRAVGRASVRFTRPTSTSEAVPQGEASPNDLIQVSFRCSSRSSARPPCLQVPQRHPGVAKRASISTLARGPSTEALLGQGRVAKGRELVPLTGLWSGSRPGLARHPRLQVVQWHPLVPKHLQTNLSRSLSSIPVGPRHGDPFHRYLRAIPAWRRGLLSALWHGDSQLKHFWGRVAWRREGNRYR